MTQQELVNKTADVDGHSDAYYHALLSKVDEALEETKRERDQRKSEIAVRPLQDGYMAEFYVEGCSPLQALTYMSDPENQIYFRPRVVSVMTVRDERDGEGVEHLELLLHVRSSLCCLPVQSAMQLKFCVDREHERLTAYERLGGTEKSHTYTFEEDSEGTYVTDVVALRRSGCGCPGAGSPLSEREHVRALQRLKNIMEVDDHAAFEGLGNTASLLFTDL